MLPEYCGVNALDYGGGEGSCIRLGGEGIKDKCTVERIRVRDRECRAPTGGGCARDWKS